MDMNRLDQTYEFALDGIQLPEQVEAFVPAFELSATLTPGNPLSLKVTVDNADQHTAMAYAARFAQELYLRLLLQFGANVTGATAPRCINSAFTAGESRSVTVTFTANAVIAASAAVQVPKDVVIKLVGEVETRLRIPQMPTSADLYTAQEMFIAGLEAHNSVVRFVVLYSALALAVVFRSGSGSSQKRVDDLLLKVNGSLPQMRNHRNVLETLYTKLRNDLIHAEGRGKNPAAAIAAIERELSSFQRDVGLVMSSL